VNITDQLLGALSQYGLPVLFGVIVIAAAGIPLPISMMLVAAGSFVELGEMKLWQVIVVASAGAVLGDQIGYALGRWGSHHVVSRIKRRKNGAAKIAQAEAFTKRWGAAGIFFSRWLITPLGPWLNLTSGMAGYPWVRFFVWDVLGEVLWVVLYVMLGKLFSDRVQALVEILGNLAWVVVGLIVAAILGWKVLKYMRPTDTMKEEENNSRALA
jgi:membrane-associated protein